MSRLTAEMKAMQLRFLGCNFGKVTWREAEESVVRDAINAVGELSDLRVELATAHRANQNALAEVGRLREALDLLTAK